MAQEAGVSAGYTLALLGAWSTLAKVRLLAVGAIATLLSLVVMADPKEPPASLRQGEGEVEKKDGGRQKGTSFWTH